jgi:hypothetical protein
VSPNPSAPRALCPQHFIEPRTTAHVYCWPMAIDEIRRSQDPGAPEQPPPAASCGVPGAEVGDLGASSSSGVRLPQAVETNSSDVRCSVRSNCRKRVASRVAVVMPAPRVFYTSGAAVAARPKFSEVPPGLARTGRRHRCRSGPDAG